MNGDDKPIAFVEDTAVAPESCREFIERFQRDRGASTTPSPAYYGHCSVGCLHIRPLINLKTDARACARCVSIANAIADLVLEFGGAMSGEHGDGLARSHFNAKLFGPALYDAFRQIKRAFDPTNLMNPGKIVDAPAMTESCARRRATRPGSRATPFDFQRPGRLRGGGRDVQRRRRLPQEARRHHVPVVHGAPATRSTRRAAAPTRCGVLSGRVPQQEFTGKRLYEVMDLCLECKACKAECPSNVDMAKLKYEFLDHYHRANGLPLRNKLFGGIATLNRGRLASWRRSPIGLPASALNRWLMEVFAGIDRRRPLPHSPGKLSKIGSASTRRQATAPNGDVVLFHDTFNNFNSPHVAIAATRFLEKAGYRVLLVDKKCCGRPMISKGMLGQAKENAAWNVDKLTAYAEKGTPVVGLEPSCLLTLRDEYPDFLRTASAQRKSRRIVFSSKNSSPENKAPADCGSKQRATGRKSCFTATAIRRPWSAPRRRSRCSKPPATKSARSTRAAAAWRARSVSKKSTTISRSRSATAASRRR